MLKYFRIAAYIKRLSRPKRILYIILFLLFFYLMSIALSPLHKMKEFENHVQSDSLFISNFDPAWSHPELAEMVRKKAGKEALLKLANKDSIHLAVNLHDSSVCLYIKGVRIHRTKIRQFKIDGLLRKMPSMQYEMIFSHPQSITSQYATIVKEPIVIRQAPKDAAEAEQLAWQPDTLFQNPAFLLLGLEQGIDLVFYQESDQGFYDKWVKFKFRFRIWSGDGLQGIQRFVTFRKQEYHPKIIIAMPVDDLRAIYRALPLQAYVVLSI